MNLMRDGYVMYLYPVEVLVSIKEKYNYNVIHLINKLDIWSFANIDIFNGLGEKDRIDIY